MLGCEVSVPGVGVLRGRLCALGAWQRWAAMPSTGTGAVSRAAALVGLHLLNHSEVATAHREAGPDLLVFGDAVFEWLLGKGLPMDSEGLVGLVKEAARLAELAAERMAPFVLADDLAGNSTAPTEQPTLP